MTRTRNTLSTPSVQPTSAPGQTWQCAFLLLPNGHVVMSGEQNTINEYVPDTAELTPTTAWRPVVTAAPSALIAGHAYQIAGRQLNGLTHANGYGDDRQNGDELPARAADERAGEVHYLRTHDFSTMGIATRLRDRDRVVEVPANLRRGLGRSKSCECHHVDPEPVAVGTRDCFLVMDRSTAGQGEVQALIARQRRTCRWSIPAILVSGRGLHRRRARPDGVEPLVAAGRAHFRAAAPGRPCRAARHRDARGSVDAAERAATVHVPLRAAVRRRLDVRLHGDVRGS